MSNLARPACVRVYWLPLGAGDNTHCVRVNGRAFELLQAASERRPRRDLYHSALEVHLAEADFSIEMGPAWGNLDARRRVVGTGPVGLRMLGRSRLFRYEVRCSRDAAIPDIAEAVGPPVEPDTDSVRAQLLLDLVPHVPRATWGRDELRTGDMWNSNSLVSWLLIMSGHDISHISPPDRGRAPGWSAGVEVASRARRLSIGRTNDLTIVDAVP